jgi:hypothetical protein
MKYTLLLPKTDGFQLYKQNTMHALLSKCVILLASQLIDRTVDCPTISLQNRFRGSVSSFEWVVNFSSCRRPTLVCPVFFLLAFESAPN